LFLWATILLFLIRSSSILFNNFAETAFLKRFGVEYLPLVYLINSPLTFFTMTALMFFLGKVPVSRLLSLVLVICGISTAVLRFVVPLGFEILYPILYILKSQYLVLLGVLFWNLANTLFNARQSKRLFPLISAGGVLGAMLGGLGTPLLVHVIRLDDFMLAYSGSILAGAMVAKSMAARFPSALFPREKDGKSESQGSLKEVLSLLKESRLVRVLVWLTLLPNILIPILNFQFNYAVDQYYGTEPLLIQFFGYFKAGLNGINFLILLFVGRLYGKWGVAVALIFHPLNYLLVFLAFLLRLDLYTAAYAKISTTIFRNTLNNPARGVLVGLLPDSYRSIVRPFLRGTVVRVGILLGSGFILILEGMAHPRYLSLVAFAFVLAWIGTTVYFKRNYASILIDLISKDMLDVEGLQEGEVDEVLRDERLRTQMAQGLISAGRADCLCSPGLCKPLEHISLAPSSLPSLLEQDDRTKIALLSLFSPQTDPEGIEMLKKIADPGKPELMVAVVKAANRLPHSIKAEFLRQVFESSDHAEVRAHAMIGLHRDSPAKFQPMIETWLHSKRSPERKAGVIAAGSSKDPGYVFPLKGMLEDSENEPIVPFILKALCELGAPGMNDLVTPLLSHPEEPVRHAALEVFEVKDNPSLRTVIGLLADPSDRIHHLAKSKIIAGSYEDGPTLVAYLTVPNHRVRQGIVDLVEVLDIKDVTVFQFARSLVARAYQALAEKEGLSRFPRSPDKAALMDHLDEKRSFLSEEVLRLLSAHDRSNRMKIIWRGVSSSDPRQRSNSLEALEHLLESSLSKVLMPLLEDAAPSRGLAPGRTHFHLPDYPSRPRRLFSDLLESQDRVTLVLTLNMMMKEAIRTVNEGALESLRKSEDQMIPGLAEAVSEKAPGPPGRGRAITWSIVERMDRLKKTTLFKHQSVTGLAAIASSAEEWTCPFGATPAENGEGSNLYLVLKGGVSFVEDPEQDSRVPIQGFGSPETCLEMALLDQGLPLEKIRTVEKTRFLVLRKNALDKVLRYYPQVGLHMMKALAASLTGLEEMRS